MNSDDINKQLNLPDKISFSIPRGSDNRLVKYELHELLKEGEKCLVYSLIDCADSKECDDFVAKIFKRKEDFDAEQKITDKMAKRQNSEGVVRVDRVLEDSTIIYKRDKLSNKFVQRVAAKSSSLAIVYTPRGHKLPAQLSEREFELMFDCMRELSNIRFIYRNFTPGHFLCTKTSDGRVENIFLVDFVSARFLPTKEEQYSGYSGTIAFAADSILKQIIEKQKIIAQTLNRDLECFVKTLIYLDTNRDESCEFKIDDMEQVADEFWKKALCIARQPADDEMLEKVHEHIMNKFKNET